MTASAGLPIWVVYEHPSDYPNECVARLFIGDQPTHVKLKGETLEIVRRLLPAGLHRLPRMEGDEPHIVECWL